MRVICKYFGCSAGLQYDSCMKAKKHTTTGCQHGFSNNLIITEGCTVKLVYSFKGEELSIAVF